MLIVRNITLKRIVQHLSLPYLREGEGERDEEGGCERKAKNEVEPLRTFIKSILGGCKYIYSLVLVSVVCIYQ